MIDRMSLTAILKEYQPGDAWPWVAEFGFLATSHKEKIELLAADAEVNGIIRPILLGDDGRVWDGHHRLCVAYMLGIKEVPVERVIYWKESK